MSKAIELKNIFHTFHQGDQTLDILKDLSLSVKPGEIVALVGPSGSGKSTLLQIAGLLEHPTSGDIIIQGENVSGLNDDARSNIRRDSIGFVYQFHHLLPEFSALENIVLPQLNKGVPLKEAKIRALDLLKTVGLENRATHRPARLSGGEQQRVAIVRAIANTPHILLADEPTGNLDPETADVVFAELVRLVRSTGMGALVATHNPDLAKRMDRTLHLSASGLREIGTSLRAKRSNP